MMPGMGQYGEGQDTTPDYCLVRVTDLTIQPGKVYQYRLRVRMANPNYKRKDVASPAYGDARELVSANWYPVPGTVQVSPEVLHYAVDQMELDGGRRKYQGLNHNRPDQNQTVLQFHRWVQTVENKNNRSDPFRVGDWVVAERVPVYRGEYLGQDVRVEFPYWSINRQDFILASETSGRRRIPGMEVSFAPNAEDGKDAVLVDFAGGQQSYDMVTGRPSEDEEQKPATKRVDDESSAEVLLLSPDGKLLARYESLDAGDKKRVERLQEVRTRLQQVRVGGVASPFGGPGAGPAGMGGRPGTGTNPGGGTTPRPAGGGSPFRRE